MSRQRLVSILCFLAITFCVPATFGQSPVTDDLIDWTEDTVDTLPDEGSGLFQPASDFQDRLDFQAVVDLFLQERFDEADSAASSHGYGVVSITDTGNGGEQLWGLVPDSSGGGHRGYFVLRPQSQVVRNLVLEAPHPLNDRRTAVMAAEVFRATGARSYFFAGTHRCANSAESLCSGEGQSCNAPGDDDEHPHRVSDMAHTEESYFQAYHEVASRETDDTLVIQLHGFSSDSSDPEFSISDATHADVSGSGYLPNALAAAMEAELAALYSPGLAPKPGNSCNRVGDDNLKCGTVNTQGRFLNHDQPGDVCQTPAAQSSTRFLHLEMSKELRGVVETDPRSPQIVIDAILSVIPQRSSSIGDLVWRDVDQDGVQSNGEEGLIGIDVRLLDASGQELDATVTDGRGRYRFGGLGAGSYVVRVPQPAGYSFTTQDADSNAFDAFDSDLYDSGLLIGRSDSQELAATEHHSDLDGGLVGACQTMQRTAVVAADRMTYLLDEEGEQDENFGDDDEIEVDGSPDVSSGLMAWPIFKAGIPASAVVQSVEIVFDVNNGTDDDYFLHQMLRDWDEETSTWKSAGPSSWGADGAESATDHDSTVLGTVNVSSGVRTIQLNAAGEDLVEGWINGSEDNFGLLMRGQTGSNGIDIESDNSETPPLLRITYQATNCVE